MFVPKHREHDWIFSTESGHFQLLLSCPQFSRLILIGDDPTTDASPDSPITTNHDSFDQKSRDESVKPLVIALSRKFCFDQNGIYNVPVLSYEDNVVSSVVLEKCVGEFVGEMLVEDVEIESEGSECRKRELRRRLRFKRMPNLVQTEVKLVPEVGFSLDSVKIGGNLRFRPDIGVLVHVYLVPMVASCALIGSYIGERIRFGFRPKALCVGVGGGALVSFLRTQLDFEVVGVEMDEVVLRVARQYFGLEDGEFLRVSVGDAIEFLEKLARRIVGKNWDSFGTFSLKDGNFLDNGDGLDNKFDVIMVDLDSGDARNGTSAPPSEFVRKDVLLAARLILSDFGIFVINVIPPSRSFYDMLIQEFRDIFQELYEIDVGNGENFVLIATGLSIVSSASDRENDFIKKLRLLISGEYMDSIRKI